MKNNFQKVGLFIWIALPFFLLIQPKSYFNGGTVKCLSKMMLDMECIGCGITRGVMHFIHLDFASAWEYNKLTFVVAPILILFWIHVLGRFLDKKWIWYLRGFY